MCPSMNCVAWLPPDVLRLLVRRRPRFPSHGRPRKGSREGFPRAGHTNAAMNVSDRELVDRLLRGDRRAFEYFFNEYYPKLYRFVRRRMPPDAAAAEDIAQGTLCRAL